MPPEMARPAANLPIEAVVFDAYGTLFDVYSVGTLAEQLFPGKGEALSLLWRDKQIEYTRIRTLSNRYSPFDAVTADALDWAAARLALGMSAEARTRLLNQYACLSAFPENLGALRALRELGVKTAILSNGTPAMLEVAIKSAGMQGLFDHVLSVDGVRQYKTAAAAYQLGPDALGLTPRQMLFVSSNGWDACGATWFGYVTMWINRAGAPPEALGVAPTATGARLTDVVDFVAARKRGQ